MGRNNSSIKNINMVRSVTRFVLALASVAISATSAFVPSTTTFAVRNSCLNSAAEAEEIDVTERRNPDRPELPEVKGDFNWDERFGGDEDWITNDVPGKSVMNEVELAAQVTALSKLEEKWRKDRVVKEYEKMRLLGFTRQAETYNGRFAMFFLVVGLLTEQGPRGEEMLRVGGFLGVDM